MRDSWIALDDPRIDYWEEAKRNIRMANKFTLDEPEFWASTLSALVNSNLASLPDSVVFPPTDPEVQAVKKETQVRVQKAIKKSTAPRRLRPKKAAN
jgi:hypothetical protein